MSKQELPSRIEVKRNSIMRTVVPGHVWRTGAFRFNPSVFATESERLNAKTVEAETQRESLARFIEDPTLHMVYCVSGSPDDAKAKYFAAYLVEQHLRYLGSNANVIWHSLYGNFDNPVLREFDDPNKTQPTMLVLTNLTPNSTTVKLEKARDLLERFPDIPRVVVCAGEDPLSFMATRLYSPVHGLLYLCEALVKRKLEIV